MLDQDVFLERALLDAGIADAEKLETARRYCGDHHVDLVEALVRTELVSSRDLALLRADVCEVPFIDLGHYEPCFANTALLPRAVADRCLAFPLFKIDDVLTLAMDDPLDLEATDTVRQITRCEVDAVLCEREHLRSLIARAYSLSSAQQSQIEINVDDDMDHVPVEESSTPVVAAVKHMLADAMDQRASDIHVNPDEHQLHLRYRIDGVLHQRQGPPLSMHASITQRLKIMAHLDITQTRRPQDGKFRFRHGARHVDVRMSTIPTVCGENVVLRLLPNTQAIQDFHELGIPTAIAGELDDLLSQPYGILLVTGPTGSGKTTTLYTALNKLNDPKCNIMTIEDPVEIRLPYVRQIQVNAEIGMTFAGALRSVLRQDPDVVLVGEVRDNETATIALQAALTGHVVLSTLHTNDAVGAIARLRDYGLPPFVLNSAVLGVIAQRLVRRVRKHCTVPDVMNDLLRHRFRLEGAAAEGFVRGKGCARCGQTGYAGRIGIYELLRFTPDICAFIEEGASIEQIREHAVHKGMRLLWQDGLEKARLGHTALEEVAKVASVVELRPPAPVEDEPLRHSA